MKCLARGLLNLFSDPTKGGKRLSRFFGMRKLVNTNCLRKNCVPVVSYSVQSTYGQVRIPSACKLAVTI